MPPRLAHWRCFVLRGLGGVAQMPQDRPPVSAGEHAAQSRRRADDLGAGQLVVDVLIRGEHTTKDYEIQKYIHTRKDREFDADIVQGDIRRLVTAGLFKDVKTFIEQAEGGVVVVFEVTERPRIREIKFLGNHGFSDKKLKKEIGVKEKDPLNSYAAEEFAPQDRGAVSHQRFSEGNRNDFRGGQAGRQRPDFPDQRRTARADRLRNVRGKQDFVRWRAANENPVQARLVLVFVRRQSRSNEDRGGRASDYRILPGTGLLLRPASAARWNMTRRTSGSR